MRVLGVDTGAGGALAVLDTGLAALAVVDMPTVLVTTNRRQRRQISEAWLADAVRAYEPDLAYVERVHALPGQGVTSSFTFGLHYGIVRGVLAGLNVPFHLITPQEWKRFFHLTASKSEARLVAARLFPLYAQKFARAKDDGRAEAALLALFGSNQH